MRGIRVHCSNCGNDVFPGQKFCSICQKPVKFSPRKCAATPNKTLLFLIVILLGASLVVGLGTVWLSPQRSYWSHQDADVSEVSSHLQQSNSKPRVLVPVDESVSASESGTLRFPIYGKVDETPEHLLGRTFPGSTFCLTYGKDKKSYGAAITTHNGASFQVEGSFETMEGISREETSTRPVLTGYKQ